MLSRTFVAEVAVLLSLAVVSPHADANVYTFAAFNIPGASYGTYAQGVNDAGQIVGFYQSAGNYGFLRDSDGTYRMVDVSGATQYYYAEGTVANGINGNGNVVGTYHVNNNAYGFLATPSTSGYAFNSISAPGSADTFVQGINNAGQIVGYSGDRSFMENNGVFTQIVVPDGQLGTFARGINNSGQIVGDYFDSNANTNIGFIYTNGVTTAVANPNAVNGTVLSGINDNGHAVGYYIGADHSFHGFMYVNGQITALDVPGSVSTQIEGVNNLDQVVGNYSDSGGKYHGFVATPVSPVPLPPSLALFFSGVGWLFFGRFSRYR